ncbi:CocE/NonD family hydrolase [Salinisphaera hydrothermalis]|uniref:CocE/NonD family hydrolase n=1 Tax=Salinisphaera hydrothermalis TaxID=563188 RepID=UPI003341015C
MSRSQQNPKKSPLPARDYHATVVNPDDGIEIAITVMQPALAAGESAPLILHGHGFGGTRLTNREQPSVYESLSGGPLPSSEAARRAANAGYFVISFDQRGFGESGGHVHIMDPDIEGGDISAILDWAEHEMAHGERLARRDGRVVAGALGLSYGGGFQMIGAAVDSRFVAIVPTATWHDLRYSLAPDNVVKTAWGSGLVALGLPTSGMDLDPIMYHALLQGLASPLTGRGVSNRVAQRLYDHSPASFFDADAAHEAEHVDPRPEREPPQVDALILQGVGDTLFNLNEGLASANALRAAGNDVSLVVMRHGHSLPFLEDIDRIAYQTDAHLAWGDQRVETAAFELAWLDWKLKGEAPATAFPHTWVILDDDTQLAMEELPVARERTLAFEGRAATGGLDLLKGVLREDTLGGLWHLVAATTSKATDLVKRWLDGDNDRDEHDTALLARLVNALPADRVDELASGGVFLPLKTITGDDHALIGIPTVEIDITGGGPSPVAFVGIGIQRPEVSTTLLVNKQVRPIRGAGQRTIELNGIATRVYDGDTVGLLVYGYHPQYLASFSAIPGHIDVAGQLGLPWVDLSAC